MVHPAGALHRAAGIALLDPAGHFQSGAGVVVGFAGFGAHIDQPVAAVEYRGALGDGVEFYGGGVGVEGELELIAVGVAAHSPVSDGDVYVVGVGFGRGEDSPFGGVVDVLLVVG